MTIDRRSGIFALSLMVLAALIAFTPTLSDGRRPKLPQTQRFHGNVIAERSPPTGDNTALLQIRFVTPEAAGAQAAATAQPPKLLGVTVSDGHRWAYFSSGGKPFVRAATGEEIDGWRLTAIGDTSATVEASGDPVVLRPFAIAPQEQ